MTVMYRLAERKREIGSREGRGLLGRRRLIKDLKTQPALWADNYCQRRKTDFLRARSARSSFKNAENNKPPAMGRASNSIGDIDKIQS